MEKSNIGNLYIGRIRVDKEDGYIEITEYPILKVTENFIFFNKNCCLNSRYSKENENIPQYTIFYFNVYGLEIYSRDKNKLIDLLRYTYNKDIEAIKSTFEKLHNKLCNDAITSIIKSKDETENE